MSTRATAVNPDLLKWARERAGLSLQDVADSLGKDAELIASWESGEQAPTYGQLEKMADQLYKRPLAIFFFPRPPIEEHPKSEFRSLPESEIENLEPDTLYALREARSMQESLRELTNGSNPASSYIFRVLRATRRQNLDALCTRVRDYLGVDLRTQISWRDLDEAFKSWRAAIEDKGVFVFKRSFKQKGISGFCLVDDQFPVIYINNSTSVSRQIFSLFHELAHLLFATSGITKDDTSYIDSLSGANQEIEIACNRFAGAFLVPDDDFSRQLIGFEGSDQEVENLASHYNVSREVILRKLLDRGLVDKAHYAQKVEEWNEQYESRAQREGGNYYATKAIYLGESYLQLAFSRYYEGRCSLQELAEHLDMKAKNVSRLEGYITRGA